MESFPLLIEPEFLARHLAETDSGNLLLLDLCRPETYQQGHIPGAIYVHPAETQLGQPPAPGLLPYPTQLQALVNRIGLSAECQVVVYDDEGGGWAGRMIWLLNSIGFHRCSLLNGGWHAWRAENYPLTNTLPQPATADFNVEVDTSVSVTREELESKLDAGTVSILDARSAAEYRGQRQTALRNGHIPGAVNFDWVRAMDTERQLRLRDLDSIKEEWIDAGLDLDKEIITHCQTHHRSGLTYVIGKLLDLDIKAYPGSWSEWGNHPSTPIE